MEKMILLLFCGMMSFAAGAVSVDEVRRYLPPEQKGQPVFSLDFDKADHCPRELPPGFSLARHEGWNGSHALAYTRSSAKEYRVLSLPLPDLPPRQKYILRYKVRAVGLRKHGKAESNAGVVCIEFMRNGKWHSGDYYKINAPGDEWREQSWSFVSKPGLQIKLTIYLRPEWVGTIYYDDINVSSAGKALAVIPLKPKMLTFRHPDFGFSAQLDSFTPPGTVMLAELRQEGREQAILLCPDQRGIVSGKFSSFDPGMATLVLTLADIGTKRQLYREVFHCQVRPDEPPPVGAVKIDGEGRILVDGKPFLPIGAFSTVSEDDFQRLSAAGFNCVHAYSSLRMRGKVLQPDPLENMRSALDMAWRHRLKFIFSLKDQLPGNGGLNQLGETSGNLPVAQKVVHALKEHPALLCWYVSDEEPRAGVPDILRLREAVAAVDPWHPAWTLTCHYDDLPYYGISGDILGVDPYPIRYDKENSSIDSISHAMQRAKIAGLPVWAVPQIFNWGAYRLKDAAAFRSSRGPTEDEMKSMTLLFAIHGAKGFIFYSAFDIFERAEKLRPGNAAAEWPKVVSTVALLRELEPFLLSEINPPPLAVQSKPENAVQARAFVASDGAIRVLIVAQTAERAELTLTLPKTMDALTSRTGKTKNSGNGRYHFSSLGVGYDILQ